jgi:2,5-dihydroxypyridine 5,6-dioxygenase
MPVSPIQLASMWRDVLHLSNVKPDEKVLLLTSSHSNPALIESAMRAAAELNAKVARLDLMPTWHAAEGRSDATTIDGLSAIEGHDLAIGAMKSADLVIDLLWLIHSPAQRQVLESGTRMLLAYEPPEVLARVMPSLEDRRRVLAARDAYGRGKRIRITSDAGTDLTAEIGNSRITAEYGFAEEPGRWDHWPSGFVARVTNAGTARGTVVLAPGDIILPFNSYVQSDIRLTIEGGSISKIEGGFDAEYLREYFKDFNDPNAYTVSHLGWGLQPKARWTALGMNDKSRTFGMEARAFYGNFLFSTGPTAGRPTPCHLDIPMRNCSFFVDNEPMVIKGDVIPEDQKVLRAS